MRALLKMYTVEEIEKRKTDSFDKLDKQVSIRCRRHKKRFFVAKDWIKTCAWLCPRCYAKLTDEERNRYAPKGKIKVREVSEKPIRRIKGYKKKYRREKDGSGKRGLISVSPLLASLLPQYKITCRKCGETVPCHYSWFDKSTVLCPTCYSSMTEMQVWFFHRQYKGEKPEQKKDKRRIPIEGQEAKNNDSVTDKRWVEEDFSLVSAGGAWSCEHIMTATEPQLKRAVKMGKVSKARYRIEMGRRKNLEYYDLCSLEPGIKPILY